MQKGGKSPNPSFLEVDYLVGGAHLYSIIRADVIHVKIGLSKVYLLQKEGLI
jgi:hypothetical protein